MISKNNYHEVFHPYPNSFLEFGMTKIAITILRLEALGVTRQMDDESTMQWSEHTSRNQFEGGFSGFHYKYILIVW